MSKIKALIKKNPEPARPANVNPGQLGQYSATNQVTEGALEQYLSSRGIDPTHLSTPTKIAHSKSSQFLKWKRDHIREDFTMKKDDGDARSKDVHSPTLQRQKSLSQVAKHYLIKPVTTHKSQVPIKKEGSQTPMLTPEEVKKQDPMTKEWNNRYLLKQLLKYLGLTEEKKQKTTALDKFRKASAEREKKHKEIEKKSGGMTAAIDRLEKQVNKEDVSPLLHSIHKKADSVRNKDIDKFVKGHKQSKLIPTKEDVGDAKAAVNGDGLPNAQLEPVSEKKRQMSKSARMIKALYKKKGMVKEDLYDHEKEDKSVATYGKKPKHEKADEKDSQGEKKPQAAAVLTGGTTLTGAKRDDIEIDPMMRNRPGQPDVTKKDDKDKKKDGKKEEKK
jgi:hypothetical protein